MKNHFLALGMVAVLALGTAAAAAFASSSANPKRTVAITEREYRISLSTKTLPAGSVTLVVHNAGQVGHALSIAGPGLAAVTTPTIAPGATKTLTVKLGGGTFNLWCPVGAHAAAGMKASLAVKGAGAASVAPPAQTTLPTAPPDYGNGY
jgi:iron uptake system component EfeO